MYEPLAKVKLSYEQFAYLLALIGNTDIAGLPQTLFSEMNEEQRSLLLGAAQRSLLANDYLRLEQANENGEQRVVVDTALYATIGTCAKPLCSLTLDRQVDKQSELNYYIGANIGVEQRSADSGVYALACYPRAQLIVMIADTLHLDGQPAPAGHPYPVSQSTYAIICDLLAAGERQRATHLLAREGFDRESANSLLDALAQPLARSSMVLIDYQDETVEPQLYVLIEGGGGFWLLHRTMSDTVNFSASPVSAMDFRARLSAMLGAAVVQS